MRRRDLAKLALVGAAGTVAAPALVRAQATFNWKMTSYYGPNAAFYSTGPGSAKDLVKRIDDMSGGRLKIQFYGAGELIRGKGGKDSQGDAAADPLDAGQDAEGLALAGRAKAEQGPAVLAHLQFGQDHDVRADRSQRVERAGRCEDLVADAADVDHGAVGAGFGKRSGEAGDHALGVIPARLLAKWWAWVMATASASAASGPAMAAPGSSRWTMA